MTLKGGVPEIQVGPLWLRSDGTQWMLSERGKNKAGDVTWTNLGYYGTLGGAVNALVDKTLSRCEAETLDQLVENQRILKGILIESFDIKVRM
jgi:hypothetical protein